MMLSIFLCAYLPSAYVFWWSVYSDLCYIFKKLACFPEFWEFSIYSGYKFFVRYMLHKDILPVCGFSFHSLKSVFFFISSVFLRTEVLNFSKVQFILLWMVLLVSF